MSQTWSSSCRSSPVLSTSLCRRHVRWTSSNTRFRRRRLEQFVVQLLSSYLSEPCAFVIEDAQAIDEASAGLLSSIAVETPTLPLLLVCSRTGGTSVTGAAAGDESATQLAAQSSASSAESSASSTASSAQRPAAYWLLELAPLDQRAMTKLARVDGNQVGGGPVLAASAMSSIVERAGGNPLFLRELLRSASAGGLDALPESIEPLLVAQIDQLPHLDRQMLRAASVLGTRFDPELLQDVLGPGTDIDDAVWSRMSEFVRKDSNGWSFAHTLMRDAAYEGLSFKRRRGCTPALPKGSKGGRARLTRQSSCSRFTGCTPRITRRHGAVLASPATEPGPFGLMLTPRPSMHVP